MDTGYVNARVRGMHSRLLDHQTMAGLVLRPDIPSLITELEKTPYRDDIERATATLSGVYAVEQALRMNMAGTFRKILAFAGGTEGSVHVDIFTSRWDIQNLKTILRGKKVSAPPQEILDSLIPAGSFDESILTEMIRQPDLKGVISLLATFQSEYAAPLVGAFEEYLRRTDTVVLEYALDRYYYHQALALVKGRGRDDRILGDLLKTEIDIVNIKSVLMLVKDHIDPEEGRNVLLDGGLALPPKRLIPLLHLVAVTDVADALASTPYRFLAEYPRPPEGTIPVSVYERLLDRYLTTRAVGLFRGDPLSVTIITGYLWAKHTEITNLRIIARCKEGLVPPEDVEAELIYV